MFAYDFDVMGCVRSDSGSVISLFRNFELSGLLDWCWDCYTLNAWRRSASWQLSFAIRASAFPVVCVLVLYVYDARGGILEFTGEESV